MQRRWPLALHFALQLVAALGPSGADNGQISLQSYLGSSPGLPDDPILQTSHRKLHGRFLHISDIHPDPHYVSRGTIATSCHRRKPKKDNVRGTFWGATRTEDCDTPYTLVNLTMKWLEDEWADKVDFVIWTGDSARHDNDHRIPRTVKDIFDLNRRTVASMDEIFTKRGVPVIPTLGNNDMYPHNIMFPGPNEITKEYESIWKSYIPFSSYQIFQRGAYFAREVVPNKLAVISLNTLYWFDSNKAVDGCPERSNDPGRLQLDWLDVQLSQFRSRNMQVWLMGHVPPSMGYYYEDCYIGYARLALRFQDTIVGHIFGHMNIDHFFWIDPHELYKPPSLRSSRIWYKRSQKSNDGVPMTTTKGPRYLLSETLLRDFQSLPPERKPLNGSQHKINYDDYAIVNVGTSIVPAFLPGVRIYGYNITGYDHDKPQDGIDMTQGPATDEDWDYEDEDGDDEEDEDGDDDVEAKTGKGSKRHHGHRHDKPGSGVDCTKPKNREKDQCAFRKPRHASPDSPSRSNKLWTPLGYTQFYLPGMGSSNKSHPPKFELEYMTYRIEALVESPPDWPVPEHLLPPSLRNLTSMPAASVDWMKTFKSEFMPYGMKDLTIPSYLKLARRIGERKGLFHKFKAFMYLGGEEP